jgi:putative membrane protein
VTYADLPTLNAVLNSLAAVLLVGGWILVRKGRRSAHRAVMLAAVGTSLAFLASYLVYHVEVGSVRFARGGVLRTVYLAILLSHTVLAAVAAPLVLATLSRALRGRFDAHRTLARVTLPVWLWVSVSGVVVYWMLYRLP